MKVTVVTTVYNGEAYLQEAIDSILNQTYKNFEYIIVNDGSKDGTMKILEGINDERVKIINFNKNEGSVKRLNYAIEQATSDWIFIQDGDDISLSKRLELQVNHIKNASSDLVLLGTFMECITGEDDIDSQRINAIESYWNELDTNEKIVNERLRGCPLCHGTVAFKKEAFLQAGKYDPSYTVAYDMDLWVRLSELGRVEKVPYILYQYRVYLKSLSNKNWVETCNQMMHISCKYINSIVFKDKPRPTFILIGKKKAVHNFYEYVLPLVNSNISFVLTEKDKFNASKIIKLYNNFPVDGILILEGIKEDYLINSLAEHGLHLNKSVFKLQNGC